MSKPLVAQHSEWLSLVEVSGPFLTLPVLKRALPLGVDPTPLPLVDDLRVAWKEVGDDSSLTARWVRWVLSDLLELPDEVVLEGTGIGPAFSYTVPEHGVKLRPDFVIVDPDPVEGGPPARMLVSVLAAGERLDERLPESKWSADAIGRLAELCRGTGVRVGLVTNGDQWALVDAPVGGPTGVATWDANLWLEERLTLDAFTTLLGVRRFFQVAATDTLEAMFAESANAEAEVTDQLGKQVRQAVELLVDAMSRANRDAGGHLFDDVSGVEIYEAAVTVMMRLVFLLSAEERGLFLLGDETYDTTYAVSTLRGQLADEADAYGEEVIARRTDAWHRLLATFRMVFSGAQHENLRLPAYGGSLFDPDRFPILEGRSVDEPWKTSASRPIAIDNRTVLHILGALQILTFKDRGGIKEARRLSFRALDVEQIGHVYEGLLDHSAVRVDEVAVGLGGKKEPELALELIETAAEQGSERLVAFLSDETGLSAKAVEKALAVEPEPIDLERLTSACDNDSALADRIAPFLNLVRRDLADLPTVYLPDSMYVTQSSDRRSSGTYYTPKVLAEEMVRNTLEPLVYAPGPAEGVVSSPKNLKSSAEILDLKICDMAMGSGAFLVAACRYLSERLLEAWEQEGLRSGDGAMLNHGPPARLLASEGGDREIQARRLVADSCLYGVDRNPMAVEMAKLSMWLITLAKDRPFTFVDHALRCGDSLLGVTDLRQLDCLHLDPVVGRRIHGGSLFDPTAHIEPVVQMALEKRRELESFSVSDIGDSARKQRLLVEVSGLTSRLRVIADLIVGAGLATATQNSGAYVNRLTSLSAEIVAALDAERSEGDRLQRFADLSLKSEYWLDQGRPIASIPRACFHWPLEFPEVFCGRSVNGFDAIVGNPPFLGGKRISGAMGSDFREFAVRHIADGTAGNADLVAYFALRASVLCGRWGLLATNTISQGDTREVALDRLLSKGWTITSAVKSVPWPGSATLEIAKLWLQIAPWRGSVRLDGREVKQIDAMLEPASRTAGLPHRLGEASNVAYIGSALNAEAFIISAQEASNLIEQDPRNADVVVPYLNGEDVNSDPGHAAKRFVLNFRDMSLLEARRYPACLGILEQRARPEILGKPASYAGWVDRWWQFWRVRAELYSALDNMTRAIVLARVSKTIQPVRVGTGQAFSDQLVVFVLDDAASLGLLSSSFHWWWASSRASTLGTGTRYTPTDCFETFPWPKELTSEMSRIAERLEVARNELMIDFGEGLTKTYNRLNDPKDQSIGVSRLRDDHWELDEAVALAYGWSDLDLRRDFRETKQGIRYAINSSARSEMLDRLLELNHQRYAEEVARGSHASRGKGKKRVARGVDTSNQLALDPVQG